MGEIVKSGTLSKYSDSVFGNKWKKVHVTINRDSWIRWYERQGDSQPKRSVQLKKVAPYLAFGEATLNIPFKPEVPKASIERLIAIPHESNRNTRLSFFLCNTTDEMKSWVEAIMRTLPPPPQFQQGPPQGQPPPNPSGPSPGGPQPPGPGGYQQPHYSQPLAAGPPPPGGPPQTYGAPPPYPGPPGGPAPGYGGPGCPPGPGAGGPPIGFNVAAGPYPTQPHPGGAYPSPAYPPGPPPGGHYPQPQYPQPPPGAYPQYPQYPQQQGPPGGAYPHGGYYGPPPPPGAGYPQPPGAMGVAAQPGQVIYVDGKKKKRKGLMSNKGLMGLAAGAAGAYVVGKAAGSMMHPWGMGGWGGGMGWRGSWSSLSSFGSCGSFGSFGSFSD